MTVEGYEIPIKFGLIEKRIEQRLTQGIAFSNLFLVIPSTVVKPLPTKMQKLQFKTNHGILPIFIVEKTTPQQSIYLLHSAKYEKPKPSSFQSVDLSIN